MIWFGEDTVHYTIQHLISFFQDGYGVTNSEDTAENAASPNVLSTSAATDLHGVAGNKRGGSQSTSQVTLK